MNPLDDKSTLVQVMAWCSQISNYIMWLVSLMPHDASRGQSIHWSKVIDSQAIMKYQLTWYKFHIFILFDWELNKSSHLHPCGWYAVGELGEDPLFPIPTRLILIDPSPQPFSPRVGVTEAPSVNFSIMNFHGQGVTKSNIWFSKSHSHLTDIITHTKLQWHLWNAKNDIISDIQQITCVMIILRNWENNDDEKIYWVAPTLDLPGPSPCSRVPQCLQGQLDVQP